MKTLIIILSVVLLQFSVFSQSNKDKALKIGKEAVNLVDQGKYDEGIKLFEQCIQLDPDNILYPYEICYALFFKKDYQKALESCLNLKDRPDCIDEVYRLIGNCYDVTGNPDKAMEIYNEGIVKFPDSGKLYHEAGICLANQKKFDEAVKFYENGIKAEPNYSSNYYNLSKIYYYTENEIWALIYAETFINLERNSKRTAELSKLLYDTYKKGIKLGDDKNLVISFCKSANLNSAELLMFEPNLEMGYSLAIISENIKTVNLAFLSRIREQFFKIWYEKGFNNKYNIGLFDYIKNLIDKGHGEAYDFYIMGYGDENSVIDWVKANNDKYESFENYYINNKLKLTSENSVYNGK